VTNDRCCGNEYRRNRGEKRDGMYVITQAIKESNSEELGGVDRRVEKNFIALRRKYF
jgi:hypothetical protein